MAKLKNLAGLKSSVGGVSRRSGMAIFAIVARSLQQISTLVITLLAAAFLMPAEYGVYALGIIFLTLIQTLTYSGFYNFIITSPEDDREVLGTSFWLITGLATAASIVLALAAFPLEWLYDATDLALVLILLAASQPFASFGAWASAALLRREATNVNFVVMFFQNLTALVGGVILLVMWQSLFALVAYRFIRVGAGLIFYLIAGARFPGFAFSKALAKRAVAYSGGLYGSRFLAFLSKYAAEILLGLYYTAAEVGLYRFGSRFANSATDVLVQPMSSFAISHLGVAARTDRQFERPARRFIGAIALLSGMMGAIVIVFAEDILKLFFDEAYLGAAVIAYALATRAAIGTGNTIMEPLFSATGQTGWILTFNAVSAVCSLMVILATLPFGYAAVSWGQVVVILGASMWAFTMIKWKAGLPVAGMMRDYLVALAVAAVFGLCLFWGYDTLKELVAADDLVQLIAGFVLGGVLIPLFLVAGYVLRVFTLDVFRG